MTSLTACLRRTFWLSAAVLTLLISLCVCADSTDVHSARSIDINCASVEQFCAVTGMDRELAEAIIGYREKNGRFQSKQDLIKVPGVTPALLEELSPWLMELPSNKCTVPEMNSKDLEWEEPPVKNLSNC